MPRKDDAPPRPAQTQTGRRVKVSGSTQRTRRAHHSRRVVNSIVTTAPAPCQASSPSGQQFARLCAAILDGAATLAANTFADARRVALHLHDDSHDDSHDDARLALGVATALTEIATQAHRAAELAAIAAARAAGEEGALWP